MDKKVAKVEELIGWRNAYSEEKQVIQGILLDTVSGEKKTLRGVNFYSVLLGFVGVASALKFLEFLKVALADNDYPSAVILLLIIVACLAFAFNFGKMLCINMLEKPVKAFADAIKKGNFQVLDVEIAETMKTQNVRGNLDGHYVRVRDLQGNGCDEILRIRFANGYNGTEAILINVILNISKKAQKKITRTLVLPKKSSSEHTWEKGIKLYQKYMK